MPLPAPSASRTQINTVSKAEHRNCAERDVLWEKASFCTLTPIALLLQTIVTLDLEGVLVPEIWIALAERTGIEALRLTTRDIPDYNVLMRGRLKLLDEHNLNLGDIQEVIAGLNPLPEAKDFLDELRRRPALFCHRLEVTPDGRVSGYRLRQENQKQKAVAALKGLNYRVIAAGDSFNDTAMLLEADAGFFFHAPAPIRAQFPQFPGFDDYGELLAAIRGAMAPA